MFKSGGKAGLGKMRRAVQPKISQTHQKNNLLEGSIIKPIALGHIINESKLLK